MRPLRLALAGFGCFRERQQVAFDDLALFAITGPTGAGKSTLLDAVTYALYGQVARLGSRGLEVLISPGCSQLYVQLEFETARGTFRVTRTADRKPSRQLERQTRIERLEEGSWRQLPESERLREADSKLVQLVGLDYEGFSRSVLLPQGAFDEFLRGDAVKRRKLLVSLLGLERIAELQRLVSRELRDGEQALAGLLARLAEDYAEVTPERQQALKAELTELAREQRQLEARGVELERELSELSALKALVEARAALAERRAQLEGRRAEVEAQRQRLARARQAAPLMAELRQLRSLKARCERLEAELAAQSQLLERLAGERAQAEAQLKRAEAQRTARLPELERALERLAHSEPLLAQLRARGGSLALAEQEAIPYSEADWERLQQLWARLPELEAAEQRLARAEAELARLAQRRAQLEAQRQAAAARQQQVTEQGLQLKAELEQAQASLRAAQLRDQAAALRAALTLGEPCPVCQRPLEALPKVEAEDLSRYQAAVEGCEAQLKALREELLSLRAQLKSAEAQLSDNGAQLAAQQQERASAQQQLAALQAAVVALGFEADSARLRPQLEARRAQLLAGLARQIAAQLGGLTEGARPALLAEKQQLEAACAAAQAALHRAEVALEAARAKQDSARAQLTELSAERAACAQALTEACAQAGFAGEVALEAAYLPPEQQRQLELAIASFEADTEQLTRRELELTKQIAGRSFDAEAYAALTREQEQLSARLKELAAELGSKRRELELLSERLDKLQGLRQRQRELEAELELSKQLAQDLRGDKFQDFLLSRAQRALAQHASHILQAITDGRYTLLLQGNSYMVKDFWQDGEPRDVRTLSGGESFIASLALALALSDTIAGSQALGALFLDEGFGTLDSEMLDSVAAVLESLSQSGRMVGVITHVQALSERLPARLVVRKGPEGSSVAWELE